MKKRLICLVTYFICAIVAALWTAISLADSFSKTSIKSYKDTCHRIYNEGISETQDWYNYDNIKINSSSREDKDILYNKGLKYVEYPDLMDLELSDMSVNTFLGKEVPFEKIEFSKNEFRIYDRLPYNSLYLKITVDRDHIDDISYYQYEECWDFKNLMKRSLIYFIVYFVVFMIGYRISKILHIFDNDENDSDNGNVNVNVQQLNNDEQENSDTDEISEDEKVSNEE